ncbi:MAG: hypothetical protein Q9166_006879 [cf. Caloplaca sp. 2 TL-2023]
MVMAAGRMQQVLGQLKSIVEMNTYDFIRFGEKGKTCIATTELNGCHAVAIISRKAAILGHWAAMAPPKYANIYPTGEQWTSVMINGMVQTFKDLKADLKTSALVASSSMANSKAKTVQSTSTIMLRLLQTP